jgi:hypothetical protein
MPMCVACGTPLDARFCRICGKDNAEVFRPPAPDAPTPVTPASIYPYWTTRPPPPAKRGSALPWVIVGMAVVLALAAASAAVVLALGEDTDDASDTEPAADPGPIDEDAPPAELGPVEDSTGALGVSVPLDWDNQDVRPFGPGEPNILATTEIDDYFRSYDAAGINFTGFAAGSPVGERYFDPSSEVQMQDWLWFSGRFAGDRDDIPRNTCEGIDADDFVAGGFTGVMEIYSDCGESGSEVIYAAGANDDDSVGIAVELILVDGDEQAAVDAILDSLVADVVT